MLIAKVENGVVIDVADHRSMFPNTLFVDAGPDKEFLNENSCLEVSVWKEYDRNTEKLVSVAPYIEDGSVFTVNVQPLTQEDLQTISDNQAISIREQRNKLLADCDWTQCKDIQDEVSTKWSAYRQALRDITLQDGFPSNVTFPDQPI